MQVLPEDNLLTIGKVKKDCCTIEVYVFHEKTYNLFCHHDIILPTIPLCMEWLDFDASEEAAGNLLAVGTVGPDIDIWDLDVVNCLEPAYQLSGQDPASAKKAKKKRKQVSVTGHSDAVMSLSWNSEYRHALASGSADQTAALWDLQECKVVTSLAHDEKVQAVQWQPSSPQSLLTGSADGVVSLFDCSSLTPTKKSWKIQGEVESVLWSCHNSHQFFVGTSEGFLHEFDARTNAELHKVQAHSGGVTSLTESVKMPGCVVSVSEDKTVKLWDARDTPMTEVVSKTLNMGRIFDVEVCPDSPFTVAIAGEREFRVLSFAKYEQVRSRFGVSSSQASAEGTPVDDEVPIGYDDAKDSDDEDDGAMQDEPITAASSEPAASLSESAKKRKKKKARRLKSAAQGTKSSEVTSSQPTALVETKTDVQDVVIAEADPPSQNGDTSGLEAAAAPSGTTTSEKFEKKSKKVKGSVHPAARRKKYKNKKPAPEVDGNHTRFS